MKFITGSRQQGLALLMATLGGGFFNYLFNMAVGRLLGPESYSVVTALLALALILTVSGETIQTVIAGYVSNFQARGECPQMRSLARGSLKRMFLLAIGTFLGIVIFSPFVADYLNLWSVHPVWVLAALFLPALLLPVNRGALQGLQNFRHYALNIIGESFIRFLAGVGFVLAGMGVSGALAGAVLGPAVMLALSFWSLRPSGILRRESAKSRAATKHSLLEWRDVYRYSLPAFLSFLLFTILINSDLIFVKHFFGEFKTGCYAAAGLVGKIALFVPLGVIPILMFPKAAALYALQKSSLRLLKKSVFATLGLSGSLTAVYFIRPRLIMGILYGSDFLPGASLLGFFGIAWTVYALVNVLMLYFLSQHRFSFIYPVVAAAVLQIALIQVFHSSLIQVVWILIGCGTFLCLSLVGLLFFSQDNLIE